MVEPSKGSLDLLQSVLESTADALLVIDEHNEALAYNDKFLELFEIPKSVRGVANHAQLIDLVSSKSSDPDKFRKDVTQRGANPESHYSYSLELEDGRIFESISKPRYMNGRFAGRVVSLSDITHRTIAEDELRASEARFRTIFESAGFGLSLFNMKGDFIACNAMLCQMMGYTEDELKRVGVTGISDPSEFEGKNRAFASQLFEGKIDRFELDKTYIRKNGTKFQGHLVCSAINDPSGRPRYGISMVIDVTQERVVQEALRESREYLRNVLTHAPVIVGAIDSKGIIRLSEGKGLEPLGRKSGELVGTSAFDLFKNEPKSLEHFQRALSGEEFIATVSSRGLSWETYWSPLRDSQGTFQGAIAVSVNVTERERIEKDREEFMAIASHELRTPITPLKMQLQFLCRHLTQGKFSGIPEAESILKLIQISEQQLERVNRLIDDMLNASQINSDKLSLTYERCDLSQIVHQVTDRYGYECSAAGCSISLVLADGVCGLWDRFRIDQVIVNLLTNALKYGSGKPIELRTEISGGRARIIMQDHGIGIPAEYQSRIFEQFHRVVPINTYGGFGLGLYIARAIITAHKGTIEVQSVPDKGATFIVELPVDPN